MAEAAAEAEAACQPDARRSSTPTTLAARRRGTQPPNLAADDGPRAARKRSRNTENTSQQGAGSAELPRKEGTFAGLLKGRPLRRWRAMHLYHLRIVSWRRAANASISAGLRSLLRELVLDSEQYRRLGRVGGMPPRKFDFWSVID